MNGHFKYVNLVGVLVLAMLCAVQWVKDRRLNLEIEHLDQVRLDQSAKVDDQANQLRGLNDDLGELKTALATERVLRVQVEEKQQPLEATNRQLTIERDELKGVISNWANAVAVRDEHMKEANARIEQLAADLNASIRKYNGLVTNYNAAVQELDGTHSRSRQ